MIRLIEAITRGIDRLTLKMMRYNLRQADEDARYSRFRVSVRGNEGSDGSDVPG